MTKNLDELLPKKIIGVVYDKGSNSQGYKEGWNQAITDAKSLLLSAFQSGKICWMPTLEELVKLISQFELLIDGDDEIELAKAIIEKLKGE